MSRKFNNKLLLGVLATLIVIFLVTTYFKDKVKASSPLGRPLVSIDSAKVKSFSISKLQFASELAFFKQSGQWFVKEGDRQSKANQTSVNALLASLLKIKPYQLLTKSESKRKDYQLTDSLATVISVNEEGSNVNLLVGKSIDGDSRSKGSYVRLKGKNEIFATSSINSDGFSTNFNVWRNNIFLKIDKSKITKIDFLYKDKNFSLSKSDSIWEIGGEKADSLVVQTYLSKLVRRNMQNFTDDFKPQRVADYQISINNESDELIVIKCWKEANSNQVYLNSSLNSDAYFKGTLSEGLFKDIFIDKKQFFNNKK